MTIARTLATILALAWAAPAWAGDEPQPFVPAAAPTVPVAAATAAGAELQQPPPPAPEPARPPADVPAWQPPPPTNPEGVPVATTPAAPPPAKPFYKKWWFWTIVGVAAVATVVVLAQPDAKDPPDSQLGNMKAF